MVQPGAGPTGETTPERRARRRREDDQSQAEIVDHAIHDAPIVNKLLKTGRMATVLLAFGTLLGGVTGALGVRILGPQDDAHRLDARIDSNALRLNRITARTDSLFLMMIQIQNTLDRIAYTQCVQLRRTDSDLRPAGCDGGSSTTAERRP